MGTNRRPHARVHAHGSSPRYHRCQCLTSSLLLSAALLYRRSPAGCAGDTLVHYAGTDAPGSSSTSGSPRVITEIGTLNSVDRQVGRALSTVEGNSLIRFAGLGASRETLREDVRQQLRGGGWPPRNNSASLSIRLLSIRVIGNSRLIRFKGAPA